MGRTGRWWGAIAACAAALTLSLALASGASAAVSCTLDVAGQIDVMLTAHGDFTSLRRNGDNIQYWNGTEFVDCEDASMNPATVDNTDLIKIIQPTGGNLNSRVDIVLGLGPFAPGATPEGDGSSEIEFQIGLGDGFDQLFIRATEGADHIVAGANGVNLNVGDDGGAPDVDLTYTNPSEGLIEQKLVDALGAIDQIRADGGSGTGGESASGWILFGGDGNDTLVGGSGGDSLIGQPGDDLLQARGGFDFLDPRAGDDSADGGPSADTIVYDFASSGVTVDLSIAGPQSTGGDGVDTLAAIENVWGSDFNDVLTGDAGSNDLVGFGGADLIRGGLGNDNLMGSDGLGTPDPGDTVAYDGAPAGVTVDLVAMTASGGHGADPFVSDFRNVIGSPSADTISGDAGPNVLTGGLGSDQIFGRAGADTLRLQDGVADTGNCGTGTDLALADSGLDSLFSCELPARPITSSPSNDFSFGKLSQNRNKGTATLIVDLPGPGQIGLEGPGIREIGIPGILAQRSRSVAGGRVKLKIRPAKKGRKARRLRERLLDKGKAKVKVKVTYVPNGGAPNTQPRKVKLLRK